MAIYTNVFIDTQAFERNAFRFDNEAMSKLSKLGNNGEVKIYISHVIDREVQDHIDAQLKKAISDFESFKRLTSFLPLDVELNESLSKVNGKALFEAGNRVWQMFIDKSDIHFIDIESLNIKKLFDSYIESRPPFNEGKKKHEFPDAINLFSIEKWLEKNQDGICIVSGDSDIERWAKERENVLVFTTLPEYLDYYNSKKEIISELVHKIVEREIGRIEDVITEKINRDVNVEVHYPFDAEVLLSNFEEVEIQNVDIIDLDISKETAVISFGINYVVCGEVEYPDLTRSMYNKEDKEHEHASKIKEEFRETGEHDIDLFFELDLKNRTIIEISNSNTVWANLSISIKDPFQ